MRKMLASLFLFLLCASSAVSAYYAENFTEAKKIARLIWLDHRETFYVACKYNKQGVVDFKSCLYTPSDPLKSKRISWEHVMPVSWYGKTLPCWKNSGALPRKGKPLSGRDRCRKTDPHFRQMESDLHNLVPAVREINSLRRDYAYAELPTLSHDHPNRFHFYVDKKRQLADPREEVRGMAARITLYMSEKYDVKLPQDHKRQLEIWNGRYPPSAWERRWHQQVCAIQGDINPYIQNYDNNKNRG
jgi:deoxyribonuclease I